MASRRGPIIVEKEALINLRGSDDAIIIFGIRG